MKSNSITNPQYWDDWWSHDIPVDPLRAHWPEFGTNGYFLRAMERHIGPLNDLSVVELGGSMSNRLVSMSKWRGVRATVVDYSEIGLASTQKLFSVNGCCVELIKSDFFR